jgi:pilus assembly protein Flp/PilA
MLGHREERPDLLDREGRLLHCQILGQLIGLITNYRLAAPTAKLHGLVVTVRFRSRGKGGLEVTENMVWRTLDRLLEQRGQGMVEYALILVLVSIVVIVILLTLGNQIANVFSNVVAALG